MRFNQVAIPLTPRTTSNCLDLALVLLRAQLRPIMVLWAGIALPACFLTYVLIDRFSGHLPLGIGVFYFASSPLGIVLIAGAAPCAFGEPFSILAVCRRLEWRLAGLLTAGAAWRLLAACLPLAALAIAEYSLLGPASVPVAMFLALLGIPPGWYLIVRTGFFAEHAALTNLAGRLHDRRADELLKGEVGELWLRTVWIAAFCTLLWLTLLATVDLVSRRLLGWPLLWGRGDFDSSYLDDRWSAVRYGIDVIWSDPTVITTAVAVALSVYTLGRLAWFFCYIDVRVRRDCWDVELMIVRETERLEETA
ncbi:MAG: hypothetical protein ACT4QC_06145 [Planctomycetaceae bacterium]